jgi:hypothetical protein
MGCYKPLIFHGISELRDAGFQTFRTADQVSFARLHVKLSASLQAQKHSQLPLSHSG